MSPSRTRGYPGFKLHLAQNLANIVPYVNGNVNENDSTSAMAALNRYASRWACPPLTTTRARRIAFFGSETSTAIAHDAINTFFHFNVPVIDSDDIMIQRMSSMRSGENDLMVLISHIARTKSLVKPARLMRENNTMVLNIATACSPLAHKATLALLDVPEKPIFTANGITAGPVNLDRCTCHGIYSVPQPKI